MRIKICRKEAKEARYWLQLTQPLPQVAAEKSRLIQEATEFVKIFNAILGKAQ